MFLSQEVDVFFSAAVDSPTGWFVDSRSEKGAARWPVWKLSRGGIEAANKNTLKKPTKRPWLTRINGFAGTFFRMVYGNIEKHWTYIVACYLLYLSLCILYYHLHALFCTSYSVYRQPDSQTKHQTRKIQETLGILDCKKCPNRFSLLGTNISPPKIFPLSRWLRFSRFLG